MAGPIVMNQTGGGAGLPRGWTLRHAFPALENIEKGAAVQIYQDMPQKDASNLFDYTFSTPILNLASTKDGKMAVLVFDTDALPNIDFFAYENGKYAPIGLPEGLDTSLAFRGVSFSPDGSALMLTTKDTIQIFDHAGGELTERDADVSAVTSAHAGYLRNCAIANGGNAFVCEALQHVQTTNPRVHYLGVVASLGSDGKTYTVDTTIRETYTYQSGRHYSAINGGVDVSPDGDSFVMGSTFSSSYTSGGSTYYYTYARLIRKNSSGKYVASGSLSGKFLRGNAIKFRETDGKIISVPESKSLALYGAEDGQLTIEAEAECPESVAFFDLMDGGNIVALGYNPTLSTVRRRIEIYQVKDDESFAHVLTIPRNEALPTLSRMATLHTPGGDVLLMDFTSAEGGRVVQYASAKLEYNAKSITAGSYVDFADNCVALGVALKRAEAGENVRVNLLAPIYDEWARRPLDATELEELFEKSGIVVQINRAKGNLTVEARTVVTQKTREASRNLWNSKLFTSLPYAGNGIAISAPDSDGWITVHGTSTASGLLKGKLPATLGNGTYIVSANNPIATSSETGINVQLRDASDAAMGAAWMSSVSTTRVYNATNQIGYLGIGWNAGQTFDNFAFRPQLELGSAATDYEPYYPASPSPEAPSPIIGTDKVTVWRGGSNLYNVRQTPANNIGAYFTAKTTETGYRFDCTQSMPSAINVYLRVPIPHMTPAACAGKTITLCANVAKSGAIRPKLGIYWLSSLTGTNIGNPLASITVYDAIKNTITFTVPDIAEVDDRAYCLGLFVYAATNALAPVAGDYVEYSDLQLEFGDAATLYEEYKGDTYDLPPAEPLNGLPGVPDSISTNGTVSQKTKRYKMLGTEGLLNTGSIPAIGYAALTIPYTVIRGAPKARAKCTIATQGEIQDNGNRIWTNAGGAIGFVLALTLLEAYGATNDRATHPEAAKAYFAAQYAAGTLVELVYELANPITEQADPVTIPALEGVNTLFADGGQELTVSGTRSKG